MPQIKIGNIKINLEGIYMFKINKIIIKGFKSEERTIEYNFTTYNTTIVYGENGCGKTTFLQILFAFFSQNEEILKNNNVKSIELFYTLNNTPITTIVQEILSENLPTPIEDEKLQLHYDWSDFESKNLSNIKTMFISVDRANSATMYIDSSTIYDFFRLSSIGHNIISSLGSSYAKNFAEQLSDFLSNNSRRRRMRRNTIFDKNHLYLNGKNIDLQNVEDTIMSRYNEVRYNTSQQIQSALFKTFSQMINHESILDNDIEYVTANLSLAYNLIQNAIDNLPDDRNNEVLLTIKASSIEKLLENCKQNEYILLLLKNMILNITPELEKLKSVSTLESNINKYFQKNKKMIISESGIKIEINNGINTTIHRLDKLSSGEKQFLTLLTAVIIDSSERNLILIDEPEISLNIMWQNELVPLLIESAPNSQIVLRCV